jgi:microcystin-dependent protein
MSFNRAGSFGAFLGVDTDNVWKVGGWSMGANSYALWREGYIPIIDVKGDLIAGTADNTVARLAVGTNGQTLIADSTQTTGLAWTTLLPPGVYYPYAGVGSTPPTGHLFCDGAAYSRTTYAALFAALIKSQVVTVTIATPGVVSWNAHPFNNNDPFKFTTTGALPTGLVASTTYYIKNKATNTFELSATPGGASINTTGTQSGTHTGICAPHGDGDGSTTFNTPDLRGRVPAGRDDLNGTSAANRLTSGGSGINGNVPGATGGAETVSLTSGQNGSHTHSDYYQATGLVLNGGGGAFCSPWGGKGSFVGISEAGASTTTGSSGSGTAHQNTQPTIVCYYIIKT